MRYDLERDDLLSIVKNSEPEDLYALCAEIRRFLVNRVSQTGGHLASNLGIVELTVAMHRVYTSPRDRFIFDVGHQSYVHKILTGRASAFTALRQYRGISGFPKSRESAHDAYDTGHSTTSLGAAAGIATARDLRGESFEVVAVIGDGAMTGGLAYEALNNIGAGHTRVRMILNDNGMSIARNVGALSKHLRTIRNSMNYARAKESVKRTLDRLPVLGRPMSGSISRTKDRLKYSVLDEEGILMEEMGIKYIGPVDGYDLPALCEAFEFANSIDGPTLVHVITTKGKGYYWAEKYPRRFHGIGPFSVDDGKLLSSSPESFSQVFGKNMLSLAGEHPELVAVCAAMGTATGLGAFWKAYPERFFDVGIAEEHAALFAAGLAKGGLTPVVAIYSSFLQRAYDQILEDVCLQQLHVVFAIDRAGLVGADGETHHGTFDISYLRTAPGMTLLAPADGDQLGEMLRYAVEEITGPVAIRYPRGKAAGEHLRLKPFSGSNMTLSEGSDVSILAVGTMLDTALAVAEQLRTAGYSVGVRSIGLVQPLDQGLLEISSRLVITLEDNVRSGGFGEGFAAASQAAAYTVLVIALPDAFAEQGSIEELRRLYGLDPDSISREARRILEGTS